MARRAQRRKRGTTLKAKDFAKGIGDDLKDDITADLNGFIRAVVSDLTSDSSRGGVSPVLTGFFASSWKADIRRPSRTDERHNFAKWSKIQFQGNKLSPGYKPLIEQRHKVSTNFKINQSIFIGNTVKYGPQALVSPKSKVFPYLAGGAGRFKEGLNDKIDRFFTDKRPEIRVGGDVDDAGRTSFQKL